MTIEVQRQNGAFQYRQREDEPTVIESRAVYRGSRWQFLRRYPTADEARAALLQIGKEGQEGKED
jgi:hypothetical protein